MPCLSIRVFYRGQNHQTFFVPKKKKKIVTSKPIIGNEKYARLTRRVT